MGAGGFLKYNTSTPPPRPHGKQNYFSNSLPWESFSGFAHESESRVATPSSSLKERERRGHNDESCVNLCPFYCKKRAVLIFFLCKDHLRLINSLYESPKKTYFLNQHFPMYPFNTQIIVIFNLFARSEEQQILPYKNVVYILGTTKSVCMQSVLSMYLHVGFNWSRSYATLIAQIYITHRNVWGNSTKLFFSKTTTCSIITKTPEAN